MPRLTIREFPGGFEARLGGRLVLDHRPGRSLVSVGRGEGRFQMYRGNFEVSERLDELVELTDCEVHNFPNGETDILFSRRGLYPTRLTLALESERLVVSFRAEGIDSARGVGANLPANSGRAPNRYRVRLPAEPEERVYGAGEQFSHFDLSGREFPLWTSEQGVGRNKLTEITRLADLNDRSGGDYWWTFFPQPTFCSSRRVFYHFDCSAYSVLDFRFPDRHEFYAWDLPSRLVIGTADSMSDLVSNLSGLLGRQPELPDWAYDGVVLGIQGGTETCRRKLKAARDAGVPVAGIWAQDWQGINVTSFGQRLRWNWEWDEERYSGLDKWIPALKAEGVRFLGYVNPYVAADKPLFAEASERGFLARRGDGSDYRVDFGEFEAGIVDFTNPRAVSWYKEILRKNLIDIGLSGWMADFGEYLPTDAVLSDGRPSELAHNEWPALWARVNREAVDDSGKGADILYFMRAGYIGSQRWCPLMWAGDQNVDWSEDDGLPSVVPAALSLAMSGHGLHHSDIGGYTTLYGMRRTRELFLRWAELAAFTPFMRTHEGNRPSENWQFDSDAETLSGLARAGRLHVALKPYLRECVRANALYGRPVQGPLFLRFEEDPEAWKVQDQYLLGSDLLVAPVLVEGAVRRRLHLPPGLWRDFWSGDPVESSSPNGRSIEVDAPLGKPPVFYTAESDWAEVFLEAARAADGA